MKILVNGIQSNLRFSSAHVIPGHESCGFIHGHSYFVDVEIEGERAGDFEFVVDFKDVKTFNLDEYYPIKRDNDQSYYYFMHDNLFNYINVVL